MSDFHAGGAFIISVSVLFTSAALFRFMNHLFNTLSVSPAQLSLTGVVAAVVVLFVIVVLNEALP